MNSYLLYLTKRDVLSDFSENVMIKWLQIKFKLNSVIYEMQIIIKQFKEILKYIIIVYYTNIEKY